MVPSGETVFSEIWLLLICFDKEGFLKNNLHFELQVTSAAHVDYSLSCKTQEFQLQKQAKRCCWRLPGLQTAAWTSNGVLPLHSRSLILAVTSVATTETISSVSGELSPATHVPQLPPCTCAPTEVLTDGAGTAFWLQRRCPCPRVSSFSFSFKKSDFYVLLRKEDLGPRFSVLSCSFHCTNPCLQLLQINASNLWAQHW